MGERAQARIVALAVGAALAFATAAQAETQAQAPAAPAHPAWMPPQLPEELKAAMAKADAGDLKPLEALAAAGHADAEFYLGVALIFGRKDIPANGKRGCALVEKASITRPDAEFMLGECYRQGLGGVTDPIKAQAAYTLAAGKNFVPAKCALGAMMLAEPPPKPARGLQLCEEGANGGDPIAQLQLGDAYRHGKGVDRNPKEARRWYEMAAAQKQPEASRKLGEMYATGEGGKKDKKKAAELWRAAESGGDPYASIQLADQMFLEITGGKPPGPGKFAFRGGIPVEEIELAMQWYQDAQKRDARPETQARAKMALYTLASFKTAAEGVSAGQAGKAAAKKP